MLDKIKQWTQRVLWSNPDAEGACRKETLESALRNLHEYQLDPRELPRPLRDHCGSAGQSPGESEDESPNCSCRNCAQLSRQLTECAICLEPLASPTRRGLTSCLECGNIACFVCAARLPRCPYCRTDNGLVQNIALQRLVYRLDIPCRNSLLPVRCPHKQCKWRGDIDSLSSHLELVHLVTILNGSSVLLDIAEFQRKAESSEIRPRNYSVLLSCFSDVFVCKVRLHNSKLKVVLSQMIHGRHGRLAAWVEISGASKTMKGIIPLSKNKSEIEVPVTNFVASMNEMDDRVWISVSIRPIVNQQY